MGITRLSVATTVLLLLIFSLSAHGQTTAPAVYSGRVVDPDGKPVAGAKVSSYEPTATQKAEAPLATAITDSQGRFQLARSRETLMCVVRADGFALYAYYSTNLENVPGEFRLKRPASVQIHIVGSDGQPVAGVRVGVTSMREKSPVTLIGGLIPVELRERLAQPTDEAGICTLPDMPQMSSIVVRVIDPMYLGENEGIETTDAAIVDAGAIRVTKGVTIEGRVVRGDTNAPVAGINVNDRVQNGNSSSGGNATTDADGKFRITQVRAGEHTLRVAALQPPLNSQFTSEPSEPMTLSPGQNIAGVELKLIFGAFISGKAMDMATGKPIAGANISASHETGIFSDGGGGTVTGEDGSYTVCVLPGEYTMRISGLAKLGYLLPQPNARKAIASLNSQSIVDFPCAANPSAAIKGDVVDAQGNPVAGATVVASVSSMIAGSFSGTDSILASGERSGGTTTTDAEGKFHVPFVTNGAMLQVRKDDLRLPEPITIDASHRDLKLVLLKVPQGSLIAHVSDLAGQPMEGVPIIISWSDDLTSVINNGSRHGKTGPDGTYRADNLFTNVNYMVTAGGNGFTTSQKRDVKVQAGQETGVTGLAVRLADSFISGIVLDENGKPLAGVMVRALGGGGGSPSVRTGMDGRFRITGLITGQTVSVSTVVDGRSSSPQGQRVAVGSENVEVIHRPPDPTPRRGGRRGIAP